MKKIASAWMEGNGTVIIAIRTLALWARPTEEHTKLQLIKVIERKNSAPGPYRLQYAIDRRIKDIQWVFVYIPFLAFSILGMLLMAGRLNSQNPRILHYTLAIIVCLVFIFRIIWFSQYLEAYRLIYHAADAIWKERLENTIAERVNIDPQPEIKAHGEQLDIRQVNESAREEVESVLPGPGKGAIPQFLLKELIKQESGRPNIFSGDLHETILLYADLSGCRPKNILNRVKYYKSRRSFTLGTENARATHCKYLEKLMRHYNAIGDNVLYKGAEDLLAFVEKNAGPKI